MTSTNHSGDHRITTALLLAAGTGSRLMPLTSNSPKCLTLVNEKSFLERLVINLNKQGFKRLVVITGHHENCIREFLPTISGDLTIEFVHSPLYKTTNNIYSLWMARHIINEPFLLVEGDLIFEASLLDDMIYPDRIAVASILPWMNGTTVTKDSSERINKFYKDVSSDKITIKYKTVNIYSFSLKSWNAIVERLNQRISDNDVNSYYETVFAEMVEDKCLSFQAVEFDNSKWYEVDTLEDLIAAEKLFPAEISEPFAEEKNTIPSTKVLDIYPIDVENEALKVAGA